MNRPRLVFPYVVLGSPFIALGVASASNRTFLFVGIAVILGGIVLALSARERR